MASKGPILAFILSGLPSTLQFTKHFSHPFLLLVLIIRSALSC